MKRPFMFFVLAFPGMAFAEPVEVKPSSSSSSSRSSSSSGSSSSCSFSSPGSYTPSTECASDSDYGDSDYGDSDYGDEPEPSTRSTSNVRTAPVPFTGRMVLSLGIRLSGFGGGISQSTHFDQSYNISVEDADLNKVPLLVLGADHTREIGRYLFWGFGASIGIGFTTAADITVDTSDGPMDIEVRANQYQAHGIFGVAIPLQSSRLSFWISGGLTVDALLIETILYDCIEEDTVLSARPLARLNASWMYESRGTAIGIYAAYDFGNRSPEVGVQLAFGGKRR